MKSKVELGVLKFAFMDYIFVIFGLHKHAITIELLLENKPVDWKCVFFPEQLYKETVLMCIAGSMTMFGLITHECSSAKG